MNWLIARVTTGKTDAGPLVPGQEQDCKEQSPQCSRVPAADRDLRHLVSVELVRSPMVQRCLAYPIVARLVCSTCAPVRSDVPTFLVC